MENDSRYGLSKAELHLRYWVNGQTCNDIAREIGKDPKTVWSWMKAYGLPVKGRGQDERQHFKKGHDLCVGRAQKPETREKIRQARIKDGSKSLFLENGDHVLKGRRGEQIHSWKGGVSPLRNAFYSSDEWKTACVSVWKRDDAKCQNCGLDHRTIDRNVKRFHIHHIASFARYPDLRAAPENLILLCDTCHRWVHSRANTESKFINKDREK
jgi:transposase-like protein